MAPAEATTISVDVVYCPGTGVNDLVTLTLPAGSTAEQALAASGLRARHALPEEGLKLGVWAKVKPGDTVLREGDRVEVYRPLRVDPKEARRQRYQRHLDRRAAKAGS